MKFLFLITHFDPIIYGAELFAKEIAERLVADGHQVDLVTGRWQSSWNKVERINGVSVYRVPVLPVRYLQTMAFIAPQWQKAQELSIKNNYDFVHAHIFPSLVTQALLDTKAKKVVTIQGGDLADYQEIYGPFSAIFRPLIGWSLKQAHKVHVVSRDLSKQVDLMTGKKAVIIPNGVDPKLLELTSNLSVLRKKYRLPKTQYLAFSPSRLTDKNNLANTIRGLELVRSKGHDLGLIIAGTGHLKQSLSALVDKLNLQKKVKLLGHVDHQDTLSLMKLSDVVVRASTHEGFGISLLEALAIGTPVVTSQEGGLKDFIDPKYAFVVKGTTARAIADSLTGFLSSSDAKLQSMKQQAQKIVKAKYTWATVYEQLKSQAYEL